MKKFVSWFVLLATAFTFVSTTVAAQQQEKSAIDLKAEIASLQTKLTEQEAKQGTLASKFAGFGKELGTAMNGFVEAMDGGLKVTTERVNEFAKTDVGRFAMFAIAWKVFATDILGLAQSAFNKTAGLILLVVFCWLLKRTVEIMCWGKMIVTKKEGPWYNRTVTKERTTPLIRDEKADGDVAVTFMVVSIIALILIFISSVVGLTH